MRHSFDTNIVVTFICNFLIQLPVHSVCIETGGKSTKGFTAHELPILGPCALLSDASYSTHYCPYHANDSPVSSNDLNCTKFLTFCHLTLAHNSEL